jgi:hypothetical protein
VLNQDTLAGTGFPVAGTDMFALYWTAAMALVLPTVAVTVTPRAFGVALLSGWLTTGIAEGVFYIRPTSSFFILSLLVLLTLTIAYAVTQPHRPSAVSTDTTSGLA